MRVFVTRIRPGFHAYPIIYLLLNKMRSIRRQFELERHFYDKQGLMNPGINVPRISKQSFKLIGRFGEASPDHGNSDHRKTKNCSHQRTESQKLLESWRKIIKKCHIYDVFSSAGDGVNDGGAWVLAWLIFFRANNNIPAVSQPVANHQLCQAPKLSEDTVK